MPASTDVSSRILVTGANGFLATWIVGDLLKKGYTVRAAVRTELKAKNLQDLYKPYGGKLEVIAVGDIMEEGAFDQAVKGVAGVVHTAASVHLHADYPEEQSGPAIRGIIGILQSVKKFGSSVKRVVATSSCVTIMDHSSTPIHLSETYDYIAPVEECEAKGRDASGLAKYSASKILAEKAAWKFMETHCSELTFDLVMLNPPYIFGPTIHSVKSLAELNSSNQMWYNAVVTGGPSPRTLPGHEWVDVRDVSLAHVLALESSTASGRIIIAAGPFVWQDFIEIAQSLNPPLYPKPLAQPEEGEKQYSVTFDTNKEKATFNLQFRTKEETTRDMLADFARKGW